MCSMLEKTSSGLLFVLVKNYPFIIEAVVIIGTLHTDAVNNCVSRAHARAPVHVTGCTVYA